MRIATFLLIGLAAVATANAQTSPPRVAFLPMPNTLPTLLFAPDPLAGTLLRPLTEPTSGSAAFQEVAPEPDVVPVAAVTPPPPDPAPEPAAEPLPEATESAIVVPPPEIPPPVETPPPAATPSATTVTVIVENVESASGNVNVALCNTGLSQEGCPYHHEVKAAEGFIETQFTDIPPGNYAIVGYHDVNGNDQFDKMMGIPREPYALSSHAAEMLVPTFADAELPIKSGENAVIIRLKRLGG